MREFKWISTELEFDDHTEEIFTVVDSHVTIEMLAEDVEHPGVVCDTYSEEMADLIVQLLNEHHAKEAPSCMTRIH